MKPLYFFFFPAVFIFLSITTLKSMIAFPSWVLFYLNDFLCMPVVLTLCLKAVHFIKKDKTIRLPLALILLLTSFYALYFEWYLPQFKTRYTADWLDVVMYFSGAIVFYLLQSITMAKNQKASKPDASV